MSHNIYFSHICATLDGSKKIISLLESLRIQKFKNFELIVVDQSSDNSTKLIVNKYKSFFKIIYLTSKKGLSISRNKGLEHASGSYLGFPDDDCSYNKDTLLNLKTTLDNNPKIFGLLARPSDDFFSLTEQRINYLNFFRLSNSNCIFIKNYKIKFNKDFGVGAKYFSSEDAILIFDLLKKGSTILYEPKISVNHISENIININDNKICNYGTGIGKFFQLYVHDIFLWPTIIICFSYNLFQFYLIKY